jgi:copper(I)-binding protein
MKRGLASVVASGVVLYSLAGCSSGKPEVSVEEVRATETKMILPAISFFMTIHNRGTSGDVLLSARLKDFPSAKVELHDVVDGRMTRIDKIEIGEGQRIEFEPGGIHLMAFKVKNPTGPLTLVLKFKESGELEINAPL